MWKYLTLPSGEKDKPGHLATNTYISLPTSYLCLLSFSQWSYFIASRLCSHSHSSFAFSLANTNQGFSLMAKAIKKKKQFSSLPNRVRIFHLAFLSILKKCHVKIHHKLLYFWHNGKEKLFWIKKKKLIHLLLFVFFKHFKHSNTASSVRGCENSRGTQLNDDIKRHIRKRGSGMEVGCKVACSAKQLWAD